MEIWKIKMEGEGWIDAQPFRKKMNDKPWGNDCHKKIWFLGMIIENENSLIHNRKETSNLLVLHDYRNTIRKKN